MGMGRSKLACLRTWLPTSTLEVPPLGLKPRHFLEEFVTEGTFFLVLIHKNAKLSEYFSNRETSKKPCPPWVYFPLDIHSSAPCMPLASVVLFGVESLWGAAGMMVETSKRSGRAECGVQMSRILAAAFPCQIYDPKQMAQKKLECIILTQNWTPFPITWPLRPCLPGIPSPGRSRRKNEDE